MGAPAGPVAGWVLARFVELDLPGPVKDFASSADLHVVAWFELNRVPDGSGGEAPQYLVAGSRGGEGRSCDFTMLRVYTWGTARKRYETAYVESDLCGRLPIHVSSGAKGPEFQFPDVDEGGADRKYVMVQTAVRRVKDAATRPARTAIDCPPGTPIFVGQASAVPAIRIDRLPCLEISSARLSLSYSSIRSPQSE